MTGPIWPRRKTDGVRSASIEPSLNLNVLVSFRFHAQGVESLDSGHACRLLLGGQRVFRTGSLFSFIVALRLILICLLLRDAVLVQDVSGWCCEAAAQGEDEKQRRGS